MLEKKKIRLRPLSKSFFKISIMFSFGVLIYTLFVLWGNGSLWKINASLCLGAEEMIFYAPSVLAAGICMSILLDIAIRKEEMKN